ncbi:MAG: MFS transporter [Pirellulales bacterium]|nr:MFS transporter [Pirellulales bacterium]
MIDSTLGSSRLTAVQWLVCIIAVIGFAFDTYELLMLPLVLRPALMEFGFSPSPNDPSFAYWRGMLFFVPAFAGGIFGLLGGYLTDRLGRRRVLTWSILIYAFSAFAAGFSTNIYQLLFFRCTTFIGVCVEFVAAVAWLAELFPDHKQRERVLGYTQAFSSVGGLLVAYANGLAVKHAADLPFSIGLPQFLDFLGEIQNPHAAWRYTLMSGLIPAIPLIVIRPFLPESPSWKSKKDAGTLKRPSLAELFSPDLRHTTIITTAMFALSYGAAFGAIQQMPQIAPGMPDVSAKIAAALNTNEARTMVKKRLASDEVKKMLAGQPPEAQEKIIAEQIAIASRPISAPIVQAAASNYTKVQEYGGLAGRFLLALLVIRIVSRRALLRVFQIPGLIVMPIVFGYLAMNNQELFAIGSWHVSSFAVGMFLVALFTVGQFSFWGNYLPRVYPLHLRGTGESFAANIGGRMIGTSFAFLASNIATLQFIPGKTDPEKMAFAAGLIGFGVYLFGLILSCWLPEPKREQLLE